MRHTGVATRLGLAGRNHTHVTDKKRILIVDDDIETQRLFGLTLKGEGFDVESAASVSAMKVRLKEDNFSAILLDVYLGSESGISALPFLMKSYPHTKVIVLTGAGSVDLAVEAMRLGASSFISKGNSPRKVIDELKAVVFSQTIDDSDLNWPREGHGLIGKSSSLCKVRESIERMKNVDSTILIFGDSGTGKELVARALHQASNRSEGKFAAINCGAIPENLLESELFGHKRGAFTDAKSDRKGFFETCSGGTLLLDEIGEMPISLQVKLLRVLQEREVTPVGSSTAIPVDTRVIAATNRNLEDEIEKRRFREDLFYRLSVLRIELPALSERLEDIPLLVEAFIEKFNVRFGKKVEMPSHEIIARLMARPWKGNIRELQNVIERGVVLATANQLSLEDIFPGPQRTQKSNDFSPFTSEGAPCSPFSDVEKRCERDYFTALLKMTRGNISEASRISQEHRARIYRILKRHGINSDSFKKI